MARATDSWQDLVRKYGYATEKAMLEDLYENNRLSIRGIAKMLGLEFSNVKYRLRMYAIQPRDRGGPNHTSETKRK